MLCLRADFETAEYRFKRRIWFLMNYYKKELQEEDKGRYDALRKKIGEERSGFRNRELDADCELISSEYGGTSPFENHLTFLIKSGLGGGRKVSCSQTSGSKMMWSASMLLVRPCILLRTY